MSRLTRLLILASLALPATAMPALAQATALRAELATPVERAETVIVDGRQWACDGTACTSRADDPRPAVACRKLVRKVGPVTRFATPRAELDAEGLAACNQGRG